MTTTSAKTTLESRLVLALTVLGALLRLWSPGRLGLVHFDEGIYALSGAWIGRPGGLDPMVIPYAPAGYPLLVGLAYLVLGASDLAAIL
ncbi:MAG TPA: 4-amino-4-deoxy-L-arabinose transferase, partial [Isosphaeraceae bacterium]|nr:4-amino-4-deoxy-L-arabinose transferase [Isosphaeraceae bacterium]